MNLKPRRREEPEINVVPLIDVVLLLVVFFMLSSRFMDEGRMRVHLPHSSEPIAHPQAEPLVISVTEHGGYQLNGRELINSSPDTLRVALLKEAGKDRNANVTIRADAHATHQAVITAMDVLGRLGFAKVSIATVRDEGARP